MRCCSILIALQISTVIPQSMCQLKRRLMHPSDPERTAMAPAHGLVFSVNAA
jgi:hypothetical protein